MNWIVLMLVTYMSPELKKDITLVSLVVVLMTFLLTQFNIYVNKRNKHRRSLSDVTENSCFSIFEKIPNPHLQTEAATQLLSLSQRSWISCVHVLHTFFRNFQMKFYRILKYSFSKNSCFWSYARATTLTHFFHRYPFSTIRFSDVFRGHRKSAYGINGLMRNFFN